MRFSARHLHIFLFEIHTYAINGTGLTDSKKLLDSNNSDKKSGNVMQKDCEIDCKVVLSVQIWLKPAQGIKHKKVHSDCAQLKRTVLMLNPKSDFVNEKLDKFQIACIAHTCRT